MLSLCIIFESNTVFMYDTNTVKKNDSFTENAGICIEETTVFFFQRA